MVSEGFMKDVEGGSVDVLEEFMEGVGGFMEVLEGFMEGVGGAHGGCLVSWRVLEVLEGFMEGVGGVHGGYLVAGETEAGV